MMPTPSTSTYAVLYDAALGTRDSSSRGSATENYGGDGIKT
jgi:hypothetical protein